MTNLTAPPRTAPIGLPAPSVDAAADLQPLPPLPAIPTLLPLPPLPPLNSLPPAGMRVPAVPSPALPPLNGRPVVPVPPAAAPDSPLAPEGAPSLLAPPAPAPAPSIPTVSPVAAEIAAPAEVIAEAAMLEIPSLPAITPAKSSVAPPDSSAAQPAQAGQNVSSRLDALQDPSASPKSGVKQGRGLGLVRTIGLIILAAGLGGGANIGYDYWQDSTVATTAVFDGTQLETWPQVDPPAIRFVDSRTRLRTDVGTRTVTSHTNLVSGERLVDVADTDLAGTITQYTGDEAATLAGAPVIDGLFTVSDVFPTEALPFITVLEGVERQLPLGPIRPARGTEIAADAASAQTAGTWHYRVIVDVESFRQNEPAAFEAWNRRLGAVAVARLEAWVDGTGIVRQIAAEVGGTNITHTLVSGAAQSERFAAPGAPVTDVPVAPITPVEPVTPAEVPAAGAVEVTE